MKSVPESHQDLLDAEFATMATLAPDGRPQLTEVWMLRDGESIAVSLNRTRHKTKNLERDPRCSLFILDLANPYRYLELRGEAEITPDDDYVFADRVGAKYGADLRAHDAPGDRRIVARIRPTRVNAVNMRG